MTISRLPADRDGLPSAPAVLRDVLAHYDLGMIHSVEPFSGGRRRAAKWIIQADRGRFLLKQRPAAKSRAARTRLAHAIQSRLMAAQYPLAKLVATRTGPSTLLTQDRYLYELFHWVEGARCNGSQAAIACAGRHLAQLHLHAGAVPESLEFPLGGFHDAARVRQHLKKMGLPSGSANSPAWRDAVAQLMVHYNGMSVQVNQLGFDDWPICANHGDWHPGNLLYRGDDVAAVLDFDALQVAPPVADVANGLLQFSLVAGDPRPAFWPAQCDHRRLLHFWEGYSRVFPLRSEHVAALPALMVETLVAEAVLPIAATGIFDQPHGLDFLQMILRKANWLVKHQPNLIDALQSVQDGRPSEASKAAS